ncbi:SDR family oxidoreductase [Streptomyces durbertensis]|uniref:SDR family oxidoreductase n=1 Tax=Streptomyces durbertensis TaxID=2448886 RepID=A0ABR6EAQ2_9ACTN|nr:SDR family NAD(P)-dependent oxidoreductase [Streptomyces durbertensis]MBB1242406.1 SDR family oxidoreductase [Streptomyces durbertensis]
MRRFAGHSVLITGAGSGIGASTARRLAAEGAAVLVTDVDVQRARHVAAAVEEAGGTAAAQRCDVTDQRDAEAAVARAVELFGRLDVLVNNAFACHPDAARFEDTDDNEWFEDFDVTVHGAYRCTKAAMPSLAAADGRGAVVNIGSVNGIQDFGAHSYSAAKAALGSLTRTLAVQSAARGVRVNMVAPGTVDTPAWADRAEALREAAGRYPLGRVGRPEDIAAAVAYLASADAAWVTGVTLPVDGGILVHNPGFRPT